MNNEEMQKNSASSRTITLKNVLRIAWLIVFFAIFLYFAISQLTVISSMIKRHTTNQPLFANDILLLLGVLILFVSFSTILLSKRSAIEPKVLLIIYTIWIAVCVVIFIYLLVSVAEAISEYSRRLSTETSLEMKSFWRDGVTLSIFYLIYIASVFCSFLTLAILKIKRLLRS